MRSHWPRRGIGAIVCLAFLVMPAVAGPKEDAFKAVETWAAAFNAGDVDKVVGSFTNEAVVLGTVSPSMISTREALKAYFAAAAARKSQVKLSDYQTIMISDNAVAFIGFYEFSRPSDAQPVVTPARFTLITIKEGAEWKVSHLHSSTRPKPLQ